jgi:hypothetical protein
MLIFMVYVITFMSNVDEVADPMKSIKARQIIVFYKFFHEFIFFLHIYVIIIF